MVTTLAVSALWGMAYLRLRRRAALIRQRIAGGMERSCSSGPPRSAAHPQPLEHDGGGAGPRDRGRRRAAAG